VGYNYGIVLNCTVNGNISTTPDIVEVSIYCGGIAGYNIGTVLGCTFDGDITASLVGGIVGVNSGTVSDCHKLSGSVSTRGMTTYTGGIIGYIANNNYNNVIVTGNTFSRTATGQQWGIGYDSRLSPAAPSNNGAMPIE